jgi:hypothetical protein
MCGSDPSRLVYRRSTDAVSLAKFTVIRRALSRQPIPATPRLLRQRLTLLRRHIGGATECIKIIRTIGLTDPSVVPRPFDGAPDRKKSPAWNCGARNGRLHQGAEGMPSKRQCASVHGHATRLRLSTSASSGEAEPRGLVYLGRRRVSQASKSHCGKRTTRSRPAALDKL